MKISTRISVMGVSLVVVSALAMLGIVIVQKQVVRSRLMDIIINNVARQEAAATVQSLCRSIEIADARTRRHSDYNVSDATKELRDAVLAAKVGKTGGAAFPQNFPAT